MILRIILLLAIVPNLLLAQHQSYRLPAGKHTLYPAGYYFNGGEVPDLVFAAQCIVRELDEIPFMNEVNGITGSGFKLEVFDQNRTLVSTQSGSMGEIGLEVYGINSVDELGLKVKDYNPEYEYVLTAENYSVMSETIEQSEKHYGVLSEKFGTMEEFDSFLEMFPEQKEAGYYSGIEWKWLVDIPEDEMSFYLARYYQAALNDISLFRPVEELDVDFLQGLRENSNRALRKYFDLTESTDIEVKHLYADYYEYRFKVNEPQNLKREIKKFKDNEDLCGVNVGICVNDISLSKQAPEVSLSLECEALGSITISSSGDLEATFKLLGED